MINIAVVVYINIEKTIATAKWVEHTHAVTAKSHELVTLMLDMETGERGYLITGKSVFLKPYYNAKYMWIEHIDNLKILVSDNSSQVARIIQIDQLQKLWLEQAAEVEIAARRQVKNEDSLSVVTPLIEKETGKKIIDEIRAIKNSFIEEEQSLLLKRQNKALTTATETKQLIVIGTLISIILSTIITLLTSTSILSNLKKLLIGTKKITEGDFDVEIKVTSKDELFILAESFNTMSSTLKQSITKMESALQVKGEFLASMSHEIRTPMNGVLGMLDLLLGSKLDKEQYYKAYIAQSSAQSLLIIINDILDFSKIEAGKLTVENIPFNLRKTLEEITESLAFQVHQKELELVLDIVSVGNVPITGDAHRLRQILTNLIGNAIKFTDAGEVIVRAATEPLDNGNLQLTCHIIDTGIGIPADKQASLFKSFTQADSSITRQYGGTGLGLTISQRLAELMSGSVNMTSEVDKGSCFTLTIPFNVTNEQPVVVPYINLSGLNILIVDDNATSRKVLRGLLEGWGAVVVEAINGKQALQISVARLEQLDENCFDIAFLDMKMPDMDGAELGTKLQNNNAFSKMKLILMTSIDELGESESFSNVGFSDYFVKPVTTSDLVSTLARIRENDASLKPIQLLAPSYDIKSVKQKKATEKPYWLNAPRILLVEDNKVNQLVAKSILVKYNLTVDIANHGEEALSKLRVCHYDLVFMDCQMPTMDGFEASNRIRSGDAGKSNSDIVIVAMTASAMLGDKDKCFNVGMSDYLSKPIDNQKLEGVLTKWLKPENSDDDSMNNYY
ncbi:response regulator [Moritella sp. Urea-trap-13]|uniref:response regulator n=1 Tax=Moritella sp. Urea-trap-13 TaxID=2058327 RepID=UPI0018E2B5AF|nr:response regulator [Moritella sp. Urea-trap-13]